MEKRHVIARLCALTAEVGMSPVFDSMEPFDCFCGANNSGFGYQFDEKVLEFIEHSVRDAIIMRSQEPEEDPSGLPLGDYITRNTNAAEVAHLRLVPDSEDLTGLSRRTFPGFEHSLPFQAKDEDNVE